MAFSKAAVLVVFAILLISSEVSAHRDLAQTTNTPTTGHDARVGVNPGRSVACNRASKQPCQSSGGNGVRKCTDPNKRECYRNENGGKGGKGGKGGRGEHGPETKN